MQKMGTDDGRGGAVGGISDNNNNNHSDTESVGSERNSSYSGPLSGSLNKKTRKTARFNIPETTSTIGGGGGSSGSSFNKSNNETYVEITLDVRDDSVAFHCVETAGGGYPEDPELTLLAKTLEKKSSFGTSVRRNASERFKQFSQELNRFASINNKRPTPHSRFDRTKSAATSALKGLKFISKTDDGSGWLAVNNRFNELTKKTNGVLPRALFCKCIGMKEESNEFALELFDVLARRSNIVGGAVNKIKLEEFWEQITDQSFDSRLQIFFDMVDKDADGRISEEEIREIISISASANKLSNIKNQSKECAALIMEELDPDNFGYILIDNLKTLLLQAPNQETSRGEDSRKLSRMLSQKLKPTKESNPIKRFYQNTRYFLIDNWQKVWVMALWLALTAGLFTYKFIQYKNKAVYEIMGYCVCTAKGAAEVLKLNMALILLPVCRNTITWLRNKTRLGVAVPFDENLNFHKVIAIGIAIGVALHAGAHLTCDFPRLLHASEEEYEPMKPYFGDDQPESYWWFVKGIEGVTGTIMVVLMAIAFILASPWFRRSKIKLPKPFNRLAGFNMFWYSHHLFIIVYALLILHGIKLYLTKEWYMKTTWMYLAVPVTLYACERLTRALRSRVKSVKVLKGSVYPQVLLALHVSKPQGFRYKSGQYMFVNCPAVSPFEWHPFSITSAPSEDYLSVHIRNAGDWTEQIIKVFLELCQPPTEGKSGLLRADFMQAGGEGGNNHQISYPTVLIDGPYGAPAQDYKDYEVVLLVGLGSGATPMISILKDIVYNMKAKEEEREMVAMSSSEGTSSSGTTTPRPAGSTSNGGTSTSSKKGPGFRTRKAYFYWLAKEHGQLDWFKDVMNEVAEMDQKGVIELHNHCTSVYEESDARSALIAILQSLNHAKHGVDIVSGTRVRTHFAKPNWRNVYKRIALNHKDSRVGVFYCGPPELTKDLHNFALDFSHNTSTKFDFHKENF